MSEPTDVEMMAMVRQAVEEADDIENEDLRREIAELERRNFDRARLREPFPPELITQVDKGFGPIDTINHAVVTDRLVRYAGDWTYEITRFVEVDGKDGMLHLLAVYGWMEIDGVRRYEVGEVERPSNYGDELKKAISDFIKRAAMRFGVGTQLWSKEELPSVGFPGGGSAEGGGGGGPAEAPAGPSRTPPPPSPRAPEAPARVTSEDTSGGEGRVISEGKGIDPNPPRDLGSFIDKDQQRALLKAFRNEKAVVSAAAVLFGEGKIQTLADIHQAEFHDLVEFHKRGAFA